MSDRYGLMVCPTLETVHNLRSDFLFSVYLCLTGDTFLRLSLFSDLYLISSAFFRYMFDLSHDPAVLSVGL